MYFNSRPHRGRHLCDIHELTVVFISTHALTEGDLMLQSVSRLLSVFQLTPSQRATSRCPVHTSQQIFQLTPSQRATLGDVWVVFWKYHFNSRPHRGRPRIPTATRPEPLFQLTPSQRATGTGILGHRQAVYFNSRPHRGRHPGEKRVRCGTEYFNSRPHRGRRVRSEFLLDTSYFNSRPHRGRRFCSPISGV